MEHTYTTGTRLAEKITKAASRQTYYTIRFLVDRDRIPTAYRAYAYFRWVDDTLDQDGLDRAGRAAFLERQTALMNACYRGEHPLHITAEEQLLVDLVRSDPQTNSPLHAYICNMMAVMAFDAGRRGRVISQEELSRYTRCLATAVTEALHYFIGHECFAPRSDIRYLAVTAAHITHMLRDTLDDLQAGYYNVPSELLDPYALDPAEVHSDPYRAWVRSRVKLARKYFQAGREYLQQVENPRCRLAGYAYTARFEIVLDAIERDNHWLRSDYPERKSPGAWLQIARTALPMVFGSHPNPVSPALNAR